MIRVVHPGSRMLTFYTSRIPDPGVKKAPDPGSATLGTGSPDGLRFGWHEWMGLGQNKRRGWIGDFCIFLRVPDVFYWNTRISCGKCDCELAYKVSCLFLSVSANHKLSIVSNDKSGLAYCSCLTKRVGTLPANPPSQWETRAGGRQNLSNPADQ